MFKFAERSLDVSDDKVLKGIKQFIDESKDVEAPDFIKNLSILSAKELELVPSNDFALVYVDKDGNKTRKYPTTDEDNALVSAIYLAKNFKQLPSEAAAIAASNILDALSRSSKFDHIIFSKVRSELYDIKRAPHIPGNEYQEPKTSKEQELRKAEGQTTEKLKDEKVARATLTDDMFALVVKTASETKRLFKIDTTENLKTACDYFDKNWRVFTPEFRNKFAMSIRNRLDKSDIKIEAPESVRKYASNEWSSTIKASIEDRINRIARIKTAAVQGKGIVQSVTGNVEGATAYTKLAELVGKVDIDKFASMLHSVDISTGLDKSYGKSLSDAFISTYDSKSFLSNTAKTAMHDAGSISFAGHTITAKDLTKLDPSALMGSMVIPDEVIDELKVDPINVFNSLPTPYKNVILQLLGK